MGDTILDRTPALVWYEIFESRYVNELAQRNVTRGIQRTSRDIYPKPKTSLYAGRDLFFFIAQDESIREEDEETPVTFRLLLPVIGPHKKPSAPALSGGEGPPNIGSEA